MSLFTHGDIPCRLKQYILLSGFVSVVCFIIARIEKLFIVQYFLDAALNTFLGLSRLLNLFLIHSPQFSIQFAYTLLTQFYPRAKWSIYLWFRWSYLFIIWFRRLSLRKLLFHLFIKSSNMTNDIIIIFTFYIHLIDLKLKCCKI